MRRSLVLVATAGLVAGCGAQTATDPSAHDASGRPDTAAYHGPSAQAITDRVVRQVLAEAPTPPGTRSATSTEAAGREPESRTSSVDLVDRHATYVVPMALGDAYRWFEDNRPPRLHQAGSGSAGGPDGLISRSLMFDGRTTRFYVGLEEEVTLYPLDAHHAVARADAMAEWLPQQTQADRAPASAREVRVTWVEHIGGSAHHATLTGAAVKRLAHLIDEQRAVGGGDFNCPNDTGAHDVLQFIGPHVQRTFVVDASGCGFISVRGQRYATWGGPTVDRLVHRLVQEAPRPPH